MSTKIRSSSQLYIDDNLQFNSKKGIGILPGTATGDAVEFDQLNAAINNAVAGAGNSIHEPVADLAAAKAVPNTDVVVNDVTTIGGKTDKMIMLVESLGLYHYDADSTAASNDGTIIRPTDVATDAAAGRWIKMSSILTDHTLLAGILGNGEYHLSLAERDKLTGVATNANNYFHPNHTGEVTSTGDGAQVITAKAVTNAKLADMAANTVKGSVAGGQPADLTKAQLLTLLNVADGATVTNAATVGAAIGTSPADTNLTILDTDSIAVVTGSTLGQITFTYVKAFLKTYFDTLYNKYIHPNHSGDVTSVADGAQTIAVNAVTNAKAAQMAANTIKGNNTGALANSADLTKTQVLALLNVADGANAYVHPNHSGDVTSTGDGATVIGANKVDNTKLATMGANTVKGSVAGGNAADLTVAQLRTMLGLIVGTNLSQRYFRATPTGLVNSSNAVFTIAALVISGTEEVFKNGLLMNAGAGNDYTITYGATTTITFITAPSGSGYADVILVNYSV